MVYYVSVVYIIVSFYDISLNIISFQSIFQNIILIVIS